MRHRRILSFSALALAVTMVGGAACISQYQVAADEFAKATAKSASSVSGLSATLVDRCWAMADGDYMAARLTASASTDDQIKAMPAAQRLRYLAGWEQWRSLPVRRGFPFVDPTTHKQVSQYATWNGYCGELETSLEGFSAGVAALTAYATALQTLAEKGQAMGAQISGLQSEVADAVTTFGKNDSSLVAATKAIQPALDDLGRMFVDFYVEKELKTYAEKADKPVAKLIAALDAYLVAVQAWDAVVADASKADVKQLEAKMLGVQVTTFAQQADGGWVESTPVASPQPRKAEALGAFVEFAQQQDQASARMQSTLASSRTVLGSIKTAHAAFVAADGKSGDVLKTFLVQFACLLKDLQGLESILAGKGGTSSPDAGHGGGSDGGAGGKCFKVDMDAGSASAAGDAGR